MKQGQLCTLCDFFIFFQGINPGSSGPGIIFDALNKCSNCWEILLAKRHPGTTVWVLNSARGQ